MATVKKKSVRIKITYWFIIISLIPLLLITMLTYFQRARLIRESAQEKLTAIRDLKVSELIRWYSEQHDDILELTLLKPVRDLEVLKDDNYRQTSDSAINLVGEVLYEFNKVHSNIFNLYYVDIGNNTIELSTNSSAIGKNLREEDYYQKIIEHGGHYHSDIYYSELEKNNTMTFATSVFCDVHDGKHKIGYLFGNIDLENEFYPLLLEKSGLGETGETLIVNEDQIAQSELRWYYKAPLRFKVDAKPAMLAAAGSTGTIISKDYRGEKVIAAYTHIPEQNWGFVCKQDIDELNAPINTMLQNITLIFIVFALLAIGTSFWLGSSVTTPLIEIDSVVARIRAGDYSARSMVTTDDEFGSLSEIIKLSIY